MRLVVCLVTIILASLCFADRLRYEYDHFAALDESGRYNLYWSVDRERNEISFVVEVQTTGWVGFGISSGNGKMKGSDLVIGWVKDCKGYLTDRYADGYSVPVLDKHQDYELTGFSEKDGTTILKFKRKIDTCDKRDRKIMEGTSKVVFAYHNKDPASPMDLKKHIGARSRTLMLLNSLKNDKERSDEELKYFDVKNKKTKIPSRDTTYWCHFVKLPEFDKKYHIVKVTPEIKNGNEGLVHHMLVYICDYNSFNETYLGKGSFCRSRNMPRDISNCLTGSLLAGWAIGQQKFAYPPNVGYPVGTHDGPKIVLIEIHYDNPDLKSDLIDDSGLRFYYGTPRKYDAGVLLTGVNVDSAMLIPPKQELFTTSGYCPSKCTEQAFTNTEIDGGGVNVFATLLHTHLAGRKAKVRHVRKGTELSEIARDDNYDFDFQEVQHLRKEAKILPGDDIITECGYNTIDRSRETWSGESTRDEMCLSALFYYPRRNISNCLSSDYHALWFWMHNYGFWKNRTAVKKFPVKWNQTMAKDLQSLYSVHSNVHAKMRCWINGKKFSDFYQKPKFVPLQYEKNNCTASKENRTLVLNPESSLCAVSSTVVPVTIALSSSSTGGPGISALSSSSSVGPGTSILFAAWFLTLIVICVYTS